MTSASGNANKHCPIEFTNLCKSNSLRIKCKVFLVYSLINELNKVLNVFIWYLYEIHGFTFLKHLLTLDTRFKSEPNRGHVLVNVVPGT